MFDLDIFEEKIKTHKGIYLKDQIVFRTINSNLFKKGIIKSPLDSKHSFTHGYRFNYPNEFPILYLAMSANVATLEAEQRLSPLSNVFDNKAFQPKEKHSIKLSGHFADLTDKRSLKSFSMNPNSPEYLIDTKEWEEKVDAYHKFGVKDDPAITHYIGDILYDSKFDGFIYYSRPAWHQRRLYNRLIIAGIAVFMKNPEFCKPKNTTCKIVAIP